MKWYTPALLVVLLIAACSPLVDDVQEIPGAQTVLWLPPGVTGPVRAYLGKEADGLHHYVVRDMATNACYDTVVGGSAGLTSTTTVNLGAQGDAFIAPYAVNTTDVWCLAGGTWTGFYMQPIASTNTQEISVNGYGGDDYMSCNATFSVTGIQCDGGTGNDYMETQVGVGFVVLRGGPGQDNLHSTLSNSSLLRMYGEDDSDCLQASTVPPDLANYDCGNGAGDRSTTVVGGHCEWPTASCP